MINKGILKFHEKKEVMVIDKDPFPLVASINIVATDLRAMLNAKKEDRLSLSVKIINVWIPKQYLVYMDDFVARRRVSTTREGEKNGRYSYHAKQEIKKVKFSKGNYVSSKERCVSQGAKGMHNPSRRENASKVVVPPHVSLGQELHVVKDRKFPQKLTKTQKRRMQKQRAMVKRQLPKEMP